MIKGVRITPVKHAPGREIARPEPSGPNTPKAAAPQAPRVEDRGLQKTAYDTPPDWGSFPDLTSPSTLGTNNTELPGELQNNISQLLTSTGRLTPQEELELWKRWKKQGDQEALKRLLKSLQPLIRMAVNTYRTAPIPPEALYAEALRLTYMALDNFDESKNVQLSTYVTHYLKKMYRFVTTHQNVARIPEARSMEVGTFLEAKKKLYDELGRDPTVAELADELKWSLRKTRDIARRVRKDLIYADMEASDEDRTGAAFNIETNVFDFPTTIDIFYAEQLTPEEQRLFDLYTGYSTGNIKKRSLESVAKEMGIPFNRARAIKRSIDKKLKQFFS